MRRANLIFFLLAFLCSVRLCGQLSSFGSRALLPPPRAFMFGAYAYYDLVRECGIGVQYRAGSRLMADLSLQRIYTRGMLYGAISQWDYYDLQGYGISLKPKYLVGYRRRFYLGLNLSFEKLAHGVLPVRNMDTSDHSIYYDNKESKGYGSTIGLLFGNQIPCGRLFFEPFAGLGLTLFRYRSITHSTTNSNYIYRGDTYPFSHSGTGAFFQAALGLKIGFSFKKTRTQQQIDRRFDEDYLPRVRGLKAVLDTVDIRNSATPATLIAAKKWMRSLNRRLVRSYELYYPDTADFYKSVDEKILMIDKLVNGKQESF